MIPEILSSVITPFLWMDHCAVYTTIASPIPRTQDTSWCINDTTLTHPSYHLDIKTALKDYLYNNATDDIAALTLWEAHKSVIRCRLIQQVMTLKHKRKTLFQKLEANFHACHTAFQSNPNSTTNSRLDFNLFLIDSADKITRKCQHIFYFKANKPDTPMAQTLRAIHHPTASVWLKTTRYTYTSNPIKILEVFRSNLAKLYSPSQNFNLAGADDLFSRITLPSLKQEQQDSLECPITDLEMMEAIKASKPHKTLFNAGASGLISWLGSPSYIITHGHTSNILATNLQCLTLGEALDRAVPYPHCSLP